MHKVISIIIPYYNRLPYLRASLDSFNYFYGDMKSLQIVIVNDGSSDRDKLHDLIHMYPALWITLIDINKKRGINPCYPINVGVRESEGSIIVLSSPEIVHTKSIFDVSNNFVELTNKNYLQFSVFCITSPEVCSDLLDTSISFDQKLSGISNIHQGFYTNLGFKGYSYSTPSGAWYTHSELKNTCYNFLSACTRDTYYALSGFNEAFVNGTGYDDTDFRDRLLAYVDNNVIWYDDCEAIHIDHPSVSTDNNTNLSLYNKLKHQVYEKNDSWGCLC